MKASSILGYCSFLLLVAAAILWDALALHATAVAAGVLAIVLFLAGPGRPHGGEGARRMAPITYLVGDATPRRKKK